MYKFISTLSEDPQLLNEIERTIDFKENIPQLIAGLERLGGWPTDRGLDIDVSASKQSVLELSRRIRLSSLVV